MDTNGLGARLRQLRIDKGYESARALDRAAGLAEGHVALIESGERGKRLSATTLARLCAALKCQASALIDAPDVPGPEAA